jgi:murein DD-endopeptidase MepM/ murein hydrolase activator NlpD
MQAGRAVNRPVFSGALLAPLFLAFISPAAAFSAPLAVTIEPNPVRQGSYAVVTVSSAEESGKIEVLDRTFPMFPVNGRMRALIPVPLATAPGKKEMVVRVSGRTARTELAVERRAGEKVQKLSRLTVDDKRAGELKDDGVAMRAALRKTSGSPLWEGPLRHPILGRISAVFGQKRVYGGGASWFHSGVDFAMAKGWPIVAVAPGRVLVAGKSTSYGNFVVVDHGQTVHTVYMHMSRVVVKPGDRLNQGQVIGLVGDTGMALGPHLHFSSYITTVAVDPLEFLERGLPE